jgi:ribosomal protein S19E (S16A)
MNQDQLMQLITMMNPEMAPLLALLQANEVEEEKPKRKPSAYNRRYAAAYRRIKRSKTLKSGKMAKGYGGKTGHKKIVKMAHAEARKKGGGRRR